LIKFNHYVYFNPLLIRGIPGEIYGYWKAHEIGGKLSWEELFQPIIKLSEEGHKVSATVRYGLDRERKRVKQDKGLSEVYVNSATGKAYHENDVIKRQNYANTLRYISKFGYRAFYEGPLTRLIVEEINQNGKL
jgi:gamma-glutamyltranspeptidase